MLTRASASLPGGVSSPFRAKFPVPLYFEDGQGARIKDVDGNEHIDYALAWGPLILGHRHPAVVEAVRRQAERPHIYGAEHELEYLVAEQVQAMAPCAERIVFTSSGSEAVQAALRLARAFTGRRLVVKFEGHYHGWIDSVLVSYRPRPEEAGPIERPRSVPGTAGQVPNATENVLAATWNDLATVEALFAERGAEIAAVIAEPVLCNSGGILPAPGFLEAVAKLARAHGALLIFDEIITGFRMSPGGAQASFGVTPDLATFGKAMGGGLPLSAIAGRAEIMDQLADGRVAFGGTFNGNPLSLAAADATLRELSRGEGELLKEANRLGRVLMEGLREAARAAGVPVCMAGFGAAFSVHFTPLPSLTTYRDCLADDADRLARFLRGMLDQGVYLLPDGRFYVSAAHTEDHIESTLRAVRAVLAGRI
jgi:glutamate-1-semialdehyde 2,1-aminomutase